MYARTLSVLSVILFTLACLPAGAETIGESFRLVSDSVVVVRTAGKDLAPLSGGQTVSVGGLGSGVLISQDGKVLTAAHVVQTAEKIVVEFPSGEVIPGRILGSEPLADVALLQLERPPQGRLVVAKLADSDTVQVGDEVFIVGAPLGISHTLTVGHISARREMDLTMGGIFEAEFFQTDAAINQGNSGGPMFDMKGDVIGIVSHIISQSGGYEGLGFVVTSNAARRSLLEGEPMWTGLEGYLIGDDLARVFNVPPPGRGILVQRVAEGSPAAQLGLRGGTLRAVIEEQEIIVGGDVIIEVLGISLGEKDARRKVRDRLAFINPGQTITVVVLREGQKAQLTMPKPRP